MGTKIKGNYYSAIRIFSIETWKKHLNNHAFANLQFAIFIVKFEQKIFPLYSKIYLGLIIYFDSTFIDKEIQGIDNYKTHAEMVCFALFQY